MATTLVMSAKLATLGLLKTEIFWNKGYNVIILDYHVTNKVLSLDSSYIVDAVMWPKFGNSSISVGEVIITSILFWWVLFCRFLTRKTTFFEGWSWFKFNILGLTLGMTLQFCDCRSYSRKTDRGLPPPSPPILNRVKLQLLFYHFIFYTQ